MGKLLVLLVLACLASGVMGITRSVHRRTLARRQEQKALMLEQLVFNELETPDELFSSAPAGGTSESLRSDSEQTDNIPTIEQEKVDPNAGMGGMVVPDTMGDGEGEKLADAFQAIPDDKAVPSSTPSLIRFAQRKSYAFWQRDLAESLDGWHGLTFGKVMSIGTHDAQSYPDGYEMSAKEKLISASGIGGDPKSMIKRLFTRAKGAAASAMPGQVYRWGVTQDANLVYQLSWGSRYFDARVIIDNTKAPEHRLVTHHGLKCVPVVELARQLVHFLEADLRQAPEGSYGEVVALRLKYEGVPFSSLSKSIQSQTVNQWRSILDLLDPFIYKSNEGDELTHIPMEDITRSGTRLLLLHDGMPKVLVTSDEFKPYVWQEKKCVKYAGKCCSSSHNFETVMPAHWRHPTHGVAKYVNDDTYNVLYYATITASTEAITPTRFYMSQSLRTQTFRAGDGLFAVEQKALHDTHLRIPHLIFSHPEVLTQYWDPGFTSRPVSPTQLTRQKSSYTGTPPFWQFYTNLFITDYVGMTNWPLMAQFINAWKFVFSDAMVACEQDPYAAANLVKTINFALRFTDGEVIMSNEEQKKLIENLYQYWPPNDSEDDGGGMKAKYEPYSMSLYNLVVKAKEFSLE